ncbi:MAG: hypothetical protein C5B53_09490 [Candidatus Melainabacteria bacterium]|nr:MAG: hypothetical protein C5B53_09490 [Candidatus Melainabacteria bacterium]
MINRTTKSALGTGVQVGVRQGTVFSGSMFNALGFWLVALVSLVLSHAPGFSWLFAPLNFFTTAVHEMGHALVCIATGGHVGGMTIVSDGAGHGGLTFCQGGNAFLYTQSGYLGAAVFGCILIALSQYPRISKAILLGIGLTIGAAGIFLMPAALCQSGMFLQGLASMVWALAMGAFLVWSGLKLKPALANLLLLFLAVQTALNSVTCIGDLITLSFGLTGMHAFSDASNMADMTGIPAFIWSIFWGVSSLVMLGFTLKETYGKRLFGQKN